MTLATETASRPHARTASDSPAVADDHSRSFAAFRSKLSADGVRYLDFVRTLEPRYGRVIRDIGLGYLALAASCAAAIWLASLGGLWSLVSVAAGAVLVGYWIAYLQLFIHEGAHYNLAAVRAASDRLCDLLIGWMVGTSVRKYRIVHFQHHRALGTVDDSEFTYFFPLNLLFILKGLTGWRALEVLLARNAQLDEQERRRQDRASTAKPDPASSRRDLMVLAGGLAAHLAIVALLFWLGGWAPALGWVAGVGVVFPFLGALRQLLEHRDDHADPAADYTRTDHGAFTRMFGDDAFSATFGGAGFNRHLLHHWEPQVSYTRLPDLERFLAKTEMGSIITARRTSYADAFQRLLSLH